LPKNSTKPTIDDSSRITRYPSDFPDTSSLVADLEALLCPWTVTPKLKQNKLFMNDVRDAAQHYGGGNNPLECSVKNCAASFSMFANLEQAPRMLLNNAF
jgi:hypothetical protein